MVVICNICFITSVKLRVDDYPRSQCGKYNHNLLRLPIIVFFKDLNYATCMHVSKLQTNLDDVQSSAGLTTN